MRDPEPLQPLPENALIAAGLRKQIKELELLLQRLESTLPPAPARNRRVEFLFSKERRDGVKPKKKRVGDA